MTGYALDLDREFPSRLSSIQFNHAAICPLPARAAAALVAYARNLTERGGLDWRDWPKKADEVRALAASLALLLEIGFPEVERRIARTLDVLVEGLPRLGFTPVLFGGPPRSGILAARPPAGKDARYFQKRLADENVVASAREGFLRFSPHVGNDEAEAERVLALLKGL